MSRFPLYSSVAFIALACAAPAFAQDAATPEQIVVVADRAPVDLAKVGSSVTVLDTETIKQRQTVMVSDLLAQTPGITTTTNGGPGGTTALRIRGAETGQTLVLIDGVQMNDPASTDNSYDFGNLLVGDISRIEILRGAASTLYGSQAIGGVVNIITAQPTQEGLSGDGKVEYGSLSTQLVQAGIGGKYDKLTFRVAGGYYATGNVSTFDSHFGGSEPDPFHNASATGRALYEFTPDISLDLRAFYTHGKNNYDGFPAPSFSFADEYDAAITDQFVGYAGLNVALFDGRLKNRIDYQHTSNVRSNYLTNASTGITAGNGHYNGANNRFEYQGNFDVAPGYSAVFGFQNENSSIKAPSSVSGHSWINSYYAQVQGEVIHGLTLTAGGRIDDHKTFGTHATGQVAAAYDLDTGTILRASFSQGFKAPTLYNLYSMYGTPSLKPEQSNSWDAGIEQHLLGDTLSLSATYFSRHTSNQINFVTPVCPGAPQCATQSGGFYQNLNRTVGNGIELQGTYNILPTLTLTSNYTHELVRDHTPGASYLKFLTRRPADTWNNAVDYTWDLGLSTGASLLYRGTSYDNAANTRKLSGYVLLNLRASYPVTENFDIYSRMDNVADKYYETIYQYGTWGRTVFIGVRGHF